MRKPDHAHHDGPWQDGGDLLDRWWVRCCPDGRYQARHKAGYVADVHARTLYLLTCFADIAIRAQVLRDREASPPAPIVPRR